MTIYDSIGQDYSNTRKSDSRIVKALLDILNCSVNSTVADIGAGTGSYALALATYGYNVIAIEPSKTMINQAIYHPKIKWIKAFKEYLRIANIIDYLSMQRSSSWIAINYNLFVQDKSYRHSIAEILKIDFESCEKAMLNTPEFGGGSSFKNGQHKSKNPLERWIDFQDDEFFCSALRDDELAELAARFFKQLPGMTEIREHL